MNSTQIFLYYVHIIYVHNVFLNGVYPLCGPFRFQISCINIICFYFCHMNLKGASTDIFFDKLHFKFLDKNTSLKACRRFEDWSELFDTFLILYPLIGRCSDWWHAFNKTFLGMVFLSSGTMDFFSDITVDVTEWTRQAGQTDGRTDGQTEGRTDGRSETNIPPTPQQFRCSGGIIISA